MKLITIVCTLVSLLVSSSVSSDIDIYPESHLNSQDNSTAAPNSAADSKLAGVINNGTSTTIVKGFFKKSGIPSQKVIKLKRSGEYFVLPIHVGTIKPSRYSVRLDTLSSHIFLFDVGVKNLLKKHEGLKRSPPAVSSNTYTFYKSRKSKTNGLLFNVKAYGGMFKGVMATETVRVGGIKMKKTPLGIILRRKKFSGKDLLDISGFDGSIGLSGRKDFSMLDAMGRNSKTMEKSEVFFSIYICSGGQAGQLQLGGVDESLLSRDKKVHNVPLVESEYPRWAVRLVSAQFVKSTVRLDVNQVAHIDSAHPYISAPENVLQELFSNVDSIQWTRVDETVLTAGRRRRSWRGGEGRGGKMKQTLPTIPEVYPKPPCMIIKCSERDKIDTLRLSIDPLLLFFTGSDLVGEEMKDQYGNSYGMCKMPFAVNTSSEKKEWRLGVPFFEKAGLIVFHKKSMTIGFAHTMYSEKICGRPSEGRGGGGNSSPMMLLS